MERAYRQSTRVLGGLLFVIGVAMVVSTLARGGGPLAVGVVGGAMLAILGLARLYLAGAMAGPRHR